MTEKTVRDSRTSVKLPGGLRKSLLAAGVHLSAGIVRAAAGLPP